MSSISPQIPWQCGLHNSKYRDNALFLNERLSDLNIIFPLHNISFPAHRLMMAKTSPYFENLFYGPMAIHDQEWKVKDNEIDPEVFKVVLGHCYEVHLLDESLEMILQVYKLADCYMIDSLKSQCLEHLRDAISNDNDSDFQLILEWSAKYGFSDIENEVFEILSNESNLTKYSSLGKPLDVGIHKKISNLLLNLPLEKHKDLLSRCEHLDLLLFEESWHHPEKILSCGVLMSIFESSMCKNGCKKDYSLLKGCIPPDAFINFINIKRLSIGRYTHQLHVYLSLIDVSHSQALYECIKDQDYDNDDFILYICLHIPCNRISAEHLAIWTSWDIQFLYLSDVDDQSVPWAVATIISLKSEYLHFPRSSLSFNGFKTLIRSLESAEAKIYNINICSCNMRVENMKELKIMANYQIEIHELDNEMDEW